MRELNRCRGAASSYNDTPSYDDQDGRNFINTHNTSITSHNFIKTHTSITSHNFINTHNTSITSHNFIKTHTSITSHNFINTHNTSITSHNFIKTHTSITSHNSVRSRTPHSLLKICLHYTNKCTILNTYKTFKMSPQHVSAHYVPTSESVISHVLKPATNSVYSYRPKVCAVSAHRIKLKCGYNNEAYIAVG